ncbi:hypothetical protein [Halomonas sp. KO116]|uniref:hypothetical protein n=1 Tax=Halomonas sp. KO116 TaxID=1504981 RepID=UPI0004E398C8|nr:hypothetical protein [Halomonas sp. KO116]AJY53177.1 hypothetical protein KO116_P200070 [Halomonas sp. KO116]
MNLSMPTFATNGYVVDLITFDGIPITLAINNVVTCTRDMSENKDRNLTVEEFVDHPRNQHRQIAVLDDAAYDTYLASYHQKAYFDKPPELITKACFIKYLEVMPALRQGTKLGMTYFLVAEPLTGSIVRMCAQYNGVYLTKWVDYLAPDTWLTPHAFRQVEVS